MKTLAALLLISVNCKDFSGDMPGILRLVMEEHNVVGATYLPEGGDPVTMEDFVADERNPYFKSGGNYYFTFPTPRGPQKAKLTMKHFGEASLSSDDLYYDLYCE